MITKIIEGVFNLLFGFIGFFTGPISDFLSMNMPDFANLLSNINTFMNNLASGLAWFIYLIPHPFTLFALTAFLWIVVNSQVLVIMIKVTSWCIDFLKRIWILGGK